VKLSRLYPIIDADMLASRKVALLDMATQLRNAGVTLLQYRDKTGTSQEVLRAAAIISEIFATSDATLILNDRADLALLAGWNSVHVGQDDLSLQDARSVMHQETRPSIVGLSTHTDDQVISADASTADYIAIGPVFSTGTKPDAEPVVGIDGVRRARALTNKPLVAIGGITLDNAREVLDAGADSVAVISGLFVPGKSVESVAREFLSLGIQAG
jgi:thiamine-phosphate pyrophosphorylase